MGFSGGTGGATGAAVASLTAALTAHIANQTAGVHGTLVAPPNLVTGTGGGQELNFDNGNGGAAKTIDLANGNSQLLTLSAATCTLTFANTGVTMVAGRLYTFLLKSVQDATGGRAIAWPGSVTWLAGAAPTLLAGASAINEFVFHTVDAGVTWLGTPTTGNLTGRSLYDQVMLPTGFTTSLGGQTTVPALSSSLNRMSQNSANQATSLTSGTLNMYGHYLPAGLVLTGIWFWSGTTALTRGSNNDDQQFCVLADNTGGTILAKGSNMGGVTNGPWAVSEPKLFPFSAPFLTTYEGLYYCGLSIYIGTGGAPAVNTLQGFSVAGNASSTASKALPILTGQANTGLTTPASLVTLTARSAWTVLGTPHCALFGTY